MKPGDLVQVCTWSQKDIIYRTGIIIRLAFERSGETYYDVMFDGKIDIIPLSELKRIKG
jgi:hypothetical protein